MRALVTDTHLRTAWCVARSLARRGVEVVGVRTRPSPFDLSRHFARRIDAPDPAREPDGWLDALRDAAGPETALVPVSSGAVRRVAENAQQLAGGPRTPRVPAALLELAGDKERTLEFAREHGIPTPQSFAPLSAEEAEKALREVGLPAVVKLREEGAFAPAERFGIARDAAEFRRLYRRLAARQPRPLVQRFAPGVGVGVEILAVEGQLRAVFGHRRLREWQTDGGPSTWCEPFFHPALECAAARFAQATAWSGPAMLEFRLDPATGAFVLLEVNPRFWGSVPLAVACGVDFPSLTFDWIRTGTLPGRVQRAVRRRRLKFASADLAACCAALAPLPRAKRRRGARAALAEWRDPGLRLGLFDPADPLVTAWELRRAGRAARRLARLAL